MAHTPKKPFKKLSLAARHDLGLGDGVAPRPPVAAEAAVAVRPLVLVLHGLVRRQRVGHGERGDGDAAVGRRDSRRRWLDGEAAGGRADAVFLGVLKTGSCVRRGGESARANANQPSNNKNSRAGAGPVAAAAVAVAVAVAELEERAQGAPRRGGGLGDER